MGINDTTKIAKRAMQAWKKSAGHDFKLRDDNYVAQTWYPFIFKNPKFTKNRGDAYTGLDY